MPHIRAAFVLESLSDSHDAELCMHRIFPGSLQTDTDLLEPISIKRQVIKIQQKRHFPKPLLAFSFSTTDVSSFLTYQVLISIYHLN